MSEISSVELEMLLDQGCKTKTVWVIRRDIVPIDVVRHFYRLFHGAIGNQDASYFQVSTASLD